MTLLPVSGYVTEDQKLEGTVDPGLGMRLGKNVPRKCKWTQNIGARLDLPT